MIGFDEARARVLANVPAMAPERVALGAALGRVLAVDLVASAPIPAFDYSAMDGYALKTGDLTGHPPYEIQLDGESAAGSEPGRLTGGAARRIFTGAPIPEGADAVVMQELVSVRGRSLVVDIAPKPGQHIRRRGEDLGSGAVAIAAGTRLSPGALAVAAMLDRPEVVVSRRPRVTVLCTGDELRAPGDKARPGSIAESNSAPLIAMAAQAAAIARATPIVRDDAAAIRRAVTEALDESDVLLTVGGVSVGDHDLVRPMLEEAGVAVDFWKVAIKPGKPLLFGRRGKAFVLALPGNPASALVTFTAFGMPLLRALQGDLRACPTPLPAVLEEPRRRAPDRLEFVRASVAFRNGELVARAHDNQASGSVTSLAASDGLLAVPAGNTPLAAGDRLAFFRWADA